MSPSASAAFTSAPNSARTFTMFMNNFSKQLPLEVSHPFTLVVRISAPSSARVLTGSTYPLSVAKHNGVQPPKSGRFRSAAKRAPVMCRCVDTSTKVCQRSQSLYMTQCDSQHHAWELHQNLHFGHSHQHQHSTNVRIALVCPILTADSRGVQPAALVAGSSINCIDIISSKLDKCFDSINGAIGGGLP